VELLNLSRGAYSIGCLASATSDMNRPISKAKGARNTQPTKYSKREKLSSFAFQRVLSYFWEFIGHLIATDEPRKAVRCLRRIKASSSSF
jgi:hypothetical protein